MVNFLKIFPHSKQRENSASMNTIIQTTHSDMCKVKNKQLSEFKHQYSARFGRIGKLIRMGKLEKRYAMHLPVLGFLGCLICHKKVNNM